MGFKCLVNSLTSSPRMMVGITQSPWELKFSLKEEDITPGEKAIASGGLAGCDFINHQQLVYLSVSASTPGSFLPSRNSRLAPPPVEMWVIWSATPAWLMALTLSPPPMIDVAALFAATAFAMALVPLAKVGNSNTPAGPFHTMVRAVETTSSMAATDLGPISRPCQSAGKFLLESHT